MLRIGLTGGIGSGKSTIAQIFKILNVPVYDADGRAKALMENNSELRLRITQLFGEGSYQGGKLNRPYIASRVFESKEFLGKLNSVVHPAVHNDFDEWCGRFQEYSYVIQEAAILFESGSYKRFDHTILVVSPEETRIKRVMERDGLTRSQVVGRMENQLTDTEKMKRAGFIIYNDGKLFLTKQVLEIHNKFVSLQT
jgi:dephospho-CoA kinase